MLKRQKGDRGLSSFVDHLLTTNMWFISELVIRKEMIEKYKRFYKAHKVMDMNHIATKDYNLKQSINNLKGSIVEKNKKIVKMKLVVANLNQKIVKKNNETIQVGVAFSFNKEETRDN